MKTGWVWIRHKCPIIYGFVMPRCWNKKNGCWENKGTFVLLVCCECFNLYTLSTTLCWNVMVFGFCAAGKLKIMPLLFYLFVVNVCAISNAVLNCCAICEAIENVRLALLRHGYQDGIVSLRCWLCLFV